MHGEMEIAWGEEAGERLHFLRHWVGGRWRWGSTWRTQRRQRTHQATAARRRQVLHVVQILRSRRLCVQKPSRTTAATSPITSTSTVAAAAAVPARAAAAALPVRAAAAAVPTPASTTTASPRGARFRRGRGLGTAMQAMVEEVVQDAACLSPRARRPLPRPCKTCTAARCHIRRQRHEKTPSTIMVISMARAATTTTSQTARLTRL